MLKNITLYNNILVIKPHNECIDKYTLGDFTNEIMINNEQQRAPHTMDQAFFFVCFSSDTVLQ